MTPTKTLLMGIKMSKTNQVESPSHYNQGNTEVIDIIEGFLPGTDFHIANAIKYILRHKHKEKPVEDLKKAIWYLERAISKM